MGKRGRPAKKGKKITKKRESASRDANEASSDQDQIQYTKEEEQKISEFIQRALKLRKIQNKR